MLARGPDCVRQAPNTDTGQIITMLRRNTFETAFAKENLVETVEFRNFRIAESESFVAVPSIGSLVPGWVLIVPKRHTLALAGLSKSLFRELAKFEEEVEALVSSEFGEVAVFEHGPSKIACKVGCGVDHAHLHIVPVESDLLAEANETYPDLKWEAVQNLQAASTHHDVGKSYLYFRQPKFLDKHFIATSDEELPSQLFRRLIAKSIGVYDQWDWKAFPNVPNMETTCNRLALNPFFSK